MANLHYSIRNITKEEIPQIVGFCIEEDNCILARENWLEAQIPRGLIIKIAINDSEGENGNSQKKQKEIAGYWNMLR